MDANPKKTVAVGISGGVDSAMAAQILMMAGYDVIGITMSIWNEAIPITEATKSGCFGPGEKDDLIAAEQICQKLGIPHHVLRLQDEYSDNVLSYFCSTYISGKTPNPCLMCNQRMKFGLLPQKAREAGIEFQYFATGHYVRVSYNQLLQRYQLFKACDTSKDQSYFLSFLHQDQLANIIFPLGDKTKVQIKAFACENGFVELAEKQESQDFLESDDYSVLFDKDTFAPGEIKDMQGKVIGKHNGLINYTIGQRRNLGISGQAEPHYVISIDSKTNSLVVGTQQHLMHNTCTAINVNWLSVDCPLKPFSATAKIRAQHEAAACIVTPLDANSFSVEFVQAQLSITPGQGIVLYEGDMVLAGGIIA
ncbi:MAG: tRNA 2-thiouridine(34) synthase MnmA [Candidatus Cloacimonetes bacterium]|nr:tRNA 2-thiouridine(34) synthase MnmA [Candidatus Cloacimonadota bacterium]